MKKTYIHKTFLYCLLSFYSITSFAWDHSVELGYGISHDPNHTKYNNSGFLLTGDLYPIKHSSWTYWSINGGLGQWYSTARHNKHLTTAAVALALRLYPYTIMDTYPTYFLGSVGPAYLSTRTFGANTQGSNLTFQFNLGLGVELNKIDVNFRAVHYSNAHFTKPDEGFTILYMLSLGYLF